MKKDFFIPIIIIIVVVCAMSFFIFSDANSSSDTNSGSTPTKSNNITESGTIDNSGNIKIEDLTFKMPEGYKKGETNPAGHISITNGTNKICFASFKDGNIDKLSGDYINYIAKKNQTATKYEITVNDIPVTKYVNDKTNATHYWFNYNGKVYRIYNDVGTPNDDVIFADLINSINN